MKILKICVGVVLAAAMLFFAAVAIKAAVNNTPYKDELVNIFKTEAAQEEVQEPAEDNVVETEQAIFQFNI